MVENDNDEWGITDFQSYDNTVEFGAKFPLNCEKGQMTGTLTIIDAEDEANKVTFTVVIVIARTEEHNDTQTH